MGRPREVVVVGAGIVGASIAWHLAASGAAVTVVDGGAAGGGATANSFAWINASWGNPEPYFRLRQRAMVEWRRLEAAVPALNVSWTGGLCWDMPDEQLDVFARQHGDWGYGVRVAGQAEIATIEPNLVAPPARAIHVADEAAVEPKNAAIVLLRDAELRGARIQLDVPVAGLVARDGAVTGIRTGERVISADEVVLAVGAGTAAMLDTIGINFAMTTPPGLLAHSRQHKRLLNGIVLAPGLHMRQTRAGRVVAGSDFGGADPGAEPELTATALLAKARSMLKGADALELDFFTLGHRPTPKGGFPAIGRVNHILGLYVAVMHSGVTLAPAIGRFTAEEILSGQRDPLLAPYGVPEIQRQNRTIVHSDNIPLPAHK
jgi:glycine/D-amino acid oxidase-like deaminating enzyme